MLKLTYFPLFISLLISCQSGGKSQTPMELYQKIHIDEQNVRKFQGYCISRRKYFYVFDNMKQVYLVENFKENSNHHLDFNNKVQVSKEKEEEIYGMLYFLEKYNIISIKSIKGNSQEKKGWERIEFRANENQILVYYNDLIVKDNLSNLYNSFKVINENWGQFESKEIK